jgi:hypothetical protein
MNERRATPLVWVGILLPVLVFGGYLLRYAVNVPWFDDIENIPNTVVELWKRPTWPERWAWFWQPNNEHRVPYAKVVASVFYGLTGQIDMRALTLFSNWSLLLLLWVFSRPVRELNLSWRYFLPVPFLLLQPQYYLSSLWTFPGLQYQPVIAFGFAAMYLLTRRSAVAFVGALLLTLLAEGTMSNGLFFWPAGLGVLLVLGRWKRLAVWAVASVAALWIYFRGYPANDANAKGLAYFLAHPHESVFGFFTFLGGALDPFNQSEIVRRSVLPTLVGFGLVLGCGYWLLALVSGSTLGARLVRFRNPTAFTRLRDGLRRYPVNGFVLGGLLFILANAAVIGLLRPRFGYFVMLVGNYKIYPTVLLVLGYLVLVTGWFSRGKRLGWFPVVLGFSVLFWGYSYGKYLPEIGQRRQALLVNIFNQRHNHVGLAAERGSPFSRFTAQVMDTLASRGVYRWPATFYTPLESNLFARLDSAAIDPDCLPLRFETGAADQVRWLNDAYPFPNETRDDGVYGILKSDRRVYLLAGRPLPYRGRNPLRRYGAGFEVVATTGTFEPGTYRLGLLEVRGGTGRIRCFTPQTLTVP